MKISTDIEYRPQYPSPYRARVRGVDPATGRRPFRSETFTTEDAAEDWTAEMLRLASRGVTPATATMPLAEYEGSVMELALRGLESKTLDPYRAG